MLRINTLTCRSHVYIVKPGVSQSGETQDATCLVERVKNALLVFRALTTYHYVIGFGRLLCSCSVSWGLLCAGMGCVNVWVKGPFRLNRYTQHCIASSHTASRVHTELHREASYEHRSACRKTNMQVVPIGMRRRALG